MGRRKTIEDRELLEIAREEFLKGGAETSMSVIAKRARMTVPALLDRIRPQERDAPIKGKGFLFLEAMMPRRVDAGEMTTRIPINGGTRARLIAGAEVVLEYLRNEMPGMLPLLADPTIPRSEFQSRLNQDPVLVLSGVITECLHAQRGGRRISANSAQSIADILVLALFGLSVLSTAGFEKSDVVRRLSVARIVDTLWQGPQLEDSKRRRR